MKVSSGAGLALVKHQECHVTKRSNLVSLTMAYELSNNRLLFGWVSIYLHVEE